MKYVVVLNAVGGPHRDPEEPAAHVSDCLALLPSGPDAVRRLRLHRVRAAVRSAEVIECTPPFLSRQARLSGRKKKERKKEEGRNVLLRCTRAAAALPGLRGPARGGAPGFWRSPTRRGRRLA